MPPQSSPKDQNQDPSQVSHSAEIYIEKYGDDAARQAKQRADELMAASNQRGGDLWLKIYRQIKIMLDKK